MGRIAFASGKVIGNGNGPYIVAEMNSSHSGNIETARKMIDAAMRCGCDAAKFQSWSAETLYSAEYYRDNPIAKRMVERFSMQEETLEELAHYCRNQGIAFTSTPYSRPEVDFLVRMEVDYIKIASMELDNLPFLRYIGAKGIPVVLSTGMGTIEEICRAVEAIEETGNRDICILHCISIYPVALENTNINNIRMLQQEFPEYPIGYSDHTLGTEAACAAVSLGAAMIEKHFTLDSSKIGWDNQMAAEPQMMQELVERCQKTHSCLGTYDRVVLPEEWEQRKKMRRSIVANRELDAGHILQMEDMDAKRPGDGLPPSDYGKIAGKRIKRRIEAGGMIREEDLYD